jgi:predicted amidohydrolase
MVCYDLRFPVWSRNRWTDGEYDFDLLVYVANWPQSRSHIWKALLAARAIENQCYVIGVNRIGKDGYGTSHAGDSMVVGPEGEILASAEKIETSIVNATLSGQKLLDFRRRYPFAPDWDQFTIHP